MRWLVFSLQVAPTGGYPQESSFLLQSCEIGHRGWCLLELDYQQWGREVAISGGAIWVRESQPQRARDAVGEGFDSLSLACSHDIGSRHDIGSMFDGLSTAFSARYPKHVGRSIDGMFGTISEACSTVYRQHFRHDTRSMFGGLSTTCSARYRKHVRRSIDSIFGTVPEACSAVYRRHVRHDIGSMFGGLSTACSARYQKHVRRSIDSMFGTISEECSTVYRQHIRHHIGSMFGSLSELDRKCVRHAVGISAGSRCGDRAGCSW